MFVSQTPVDHFLDFITSPHVIQGLPFGQRSIKLSTKEVAIVPNVVRMMVPESIVKQYFAYAEESNFDPLSRRTLLKILSVCSASVRKSLQGLDYVSSNWARAFDELCDVAQRLRLQGDVMGKRAEGTPQKHQAILEERLQGKECHFICLVVKLRFCRVINLTTTFSLLSKSECMENIF